MSTDKSLKSNSALARHRNVLTRSERLEVLKDDERWTEEQSVFGLPKVRTLRVARRGKSKSKKAEEGEANGK